MKHIALLKQLDCEEYSLQAGDQLAVCATFLATARPSSGRSAGTGDIEAVEQGCRSVPPFSPTPDYTGQDEPSHWFG